MVQKKKYLFISLGIILITAFSLFILRNKFLHVFLTQEQEKFKEKITNDPFPIVPVGALIDACGLIGKTIGGARITEEHANIIHNFNNAKAADVLDLINLVKEKVKQKFHINLE